MMDFAKIFPVCKKRIRDKLWEQLVEDIGDDSVPISFIQRLDLIKKEKGGIPAFFPDLARVELAQWKAETFKFNYNTNPRKYRPNPSLEILSVAYRDLDRLVAVRDVFLAPIPGETMILVWQDPATKKVRLKTAGKRHILGLKVVIEDLDPRRLAEEYGITIGYVDSAVDLCVRQGLILSPQSSIIRRGSAFFDKPVDPRYNSSDVFTIQWHITQVCDLHCKHCYDRSSRKTVSHAQGLDLLDQLRDFCRHRHVAGQVSFSGGNPFLHPNFFDLYQAAADRNFGIAILGNVVSRSDLEKCSKIMKPVFYQVSLEGLKEHNDAIRGRGYYDKVFTFLDELRGMGIYSMVMLTLTSGNMDQVVPLAEELRDKVDLLTFNRLAMVGEGAGLTGADVPVYRQFLETYIEAARTNTCMALKDSLFNIIRNENGEELFGGCAGHGCGAAFNFVAITPDCEVHACRKYPSPIGSLLSDSLAAVYDSDLAERYRQGTQACIDCDIRPVCGGCPAVVYGLGLDPFKDRDPYCFL